MNLASPTAVTVGEIARRLDVSPSTVSRVLKNHPGISEPTRRRTLDMVKKLGYRPNKRVQRYFKSIRQENDVAAFLVSAAVHTELQAQDAFYGRIQWALQAALHAAKIHMLLNNTATDLLADGNLYAVAEGMADGVIAEVPDATVVKRLATHTPVVALNADVRCPNVDVVLPDVERATRDQMDHLVKLGHRRIACFRPRPSTHWQDRRFWREYEEHGARNGLVMPAEYLQTIEFRKYDHPRAIDAFLDQVLRSGMAPTAILTYDVYAGDLIRQLQARGLNVPQDVSLIGFDDDTHAQSCPIPLTTFRQDFEAMAQTAVELLRERMKDPQRAARVVELEGKLVVRESTAPAPSPQQSGIAATTL